MKYFNIYYICLISAFFSVYLILKDGVIIDFDTISYVKAWNSFSSGEIDLWRTPTYPLFLGILMWCFGKQFMLAAIIIQFATFLVSIYYFYKTGISIIDNKTCVIAITIFYALFPCISTWNNYILTESFAVYALIFTLYYLTKAYIDNSNRYHIHLFFCILFLVFLRPAIIFIIPILFFILCILGIKTSWGKNIRIGLINLIIICFFLGGYTYLYYKKYGILSPTAVGVLNNYYMARMDGILKPEMANNKELSLYIERSISKHGVRYANGSGFDLGREGITAIHNYGPKAVSDLISKSDFNSISNRTKRFLQHLRKASQDKLFSTYNIRWNYISDITCLKINALYIMLFIYTIVLSYWTFKRKILAWFSFLLLLLGTGHLFVILYSCQNVWYRLIIPFTPVYLLMIGQLCSLLEVKETDKQFLK